jgi:hypothetical protein
MVVNFRVREISQGMHKLAWTSMLIKKNDHIVKMVHDMTKELMSSPKCRSVEVINNSARSGSNHREVNCITINKEIDNNRKGVEESFEM